MPSFDVTSDVNWQEVDNAINQANKEVLTRFDFKGVKTEITLDRKAKTVTLWSSVEGKLEALNDMFQSKLVKRGISLLALDYQPIDQAFGGSVRQVINVMAGIPKEKAKEIIQSVKDSKAKVQCQIQDETVRVSGKNRDDLQTVIAFLRGQQDKLKVPMQFGNFRD
jgi:uncharacterized protein YajQ (UPF0234 family)